MQTAPEPVRPTVDALTAPDRSALAALWTGAARGGAADVPALAELVLLLTALGAPGALVQRAAQCTAAQADAATRACALAAAYRGRPLELPPPAGLLSRTPGGTRRPRRALRRLALRALRDGCLLGGHAAQVTCWASATSTDPAVRASLLVIADAEAWCAALWADVLTWALQQQPRLVGRLRRVDLAERSPLLERPAEADPAVLAAHGWPRPEEVARMWAAHRPTVLARLH